MERHILMIDDDEDEYTFLKTVIEDMPNVKCSYAGNARTGLELLKTGRYDVALVDMNMPMVNGLECLKRIKEDEALSHIPAFIYTTCNTDDLSAQALELGAVDCIKKPYSFAAVKDMIGKMLLLSEMQAIRLRHRQGKGNA